MLRVSTRWARCTGWLNNAPGSAATVLSNLANELGAIQSLITSNNAAFSSQDDITAHALDLADHGGSPASDTHSHRNIAGNPATPLNKTPIGVIPGLSLRQLMLDLQATDGPAAFNSQRIWVDIINATRDIASGLTDITSTLNASNSGAAIDAMTSRLTDTATRSTTIAGNASVLNTALGQLDAARMTKLGEVTAALLEIEALNAYGPAGAAAARAAEQLFLGYYAATTQAELLALIPPVSALTTADHGTAGGTTTSTMSTVDGSGMRYTTSGVITPESLTRTIYDAAQAHPETFTRLNNITRDMATGAGADIGEGLFSPQALNPGAGDTVTGASIATTPASITPPHAAPSAPSAPAGISALTPSATGTPPPNAVGAFMPQQTAAHLPATAGAGTRIAAGGPLTTGATLPLTGPLTGPMHGQAGTPHTSGPAQNTSALRGTASGVLPTGAAPRSTGLAAPSAPQPAPASDGDSARRATHAPGAASGTAAAAGGHTGTSRGGAAPLVGAGMHPGAGAGAGARGGGRTSPRSAVRSITSQAERDNDKRALLGERPQVVPGVIGDWAREHPGAR